MAWSLAFPSEFRPFELNSHGPFSKYVFVEWVVVMNVILFWGNLITKGGALGYVRSIDLSAPFLHSLFFFSPTPLPSPPYRQYSLDTTQFKLSCWCFVYKRLEVSCGEVASLSTASFDWPQSKIHLIPFSQVSADRLMYHYAMEQVTTFNVEACHSLFARSCIFYHVSSCFCFCI